MIGKDVTEELTKKSAVAVDEEIDEWMKLSNNLHWEQKQP